MPAVLARPPTKMLDGANDAPKSMPSGFFDENSTAVAVISSDSSSRVIRTPRSLAPHVDRQRGQRGHHGPGDQRPDPPLPVDADLVGHLGGDDPAEEAVHRELHRQVGDERDERRPDARDDPEPPPDEGEEGADVGDLASPSRRTRPRTGAGRCRRRRRRPGRRRRCRPRSRPARRRSCPPRGQRQRRRRRRSPGRPGVRCGARTPRSARGLVGAGSCGSPRHSGPRSRGQSRSDTNDFAPESAVGHLRCQGSRALSGIGSVRDRALAAAPRRTWRTGRSIGSRRTERHPGRFGRPQGWSPVPGP